MVQNISAYSPKNSSSNGAETATAADDKVGVELVCCFDYHFSGFALQTFKSVPHLEERKCGIECHRNLGTVVQNFVSLTSSLRSQLVK